MGIQSCKVLSDLPCPHVWSRMDLPDQQYKGEIQSEHIAFPPTYSHTFCFTSFETICIVIFLVTSNISALAQQSKPVSILYISLLLYHCHVSVCAFQLHMECKYTSKLIYMKVFKVDIKEEYFFSNMILYSI